MLVNGIALGMKQEMRKPLPTTVAEAGCAGRDLVAARLLVVPRSPPMRHLGRLDGSLGEDLLNDCVLVGSAENGVEVLLARAGKETLRTLAGVENVEAVDDVDKRDRAE